MATARKSLSDLKDLAAGTATSNANMQHNQKSTFPILTTAERDALAAGAKFEGMIIYNTTTNKLNFYTGAAWEAVTSA